MNFGSGDPLAQDLGRRAMACKGARYQPGMVAAGAGLGRVVVAVWGTVLVVADSLSGEACLDVVEAGECWPDLRDPGTVGHCLAMTRAATDASLFTELDDGRWWWMLPTLNGRADTEAEAIIAAWETA